MLQSLGITAFLLPLWAGGLGWGWIRSRTNGAIWLRSLGAVLAISFAPAVFGLLPWHWRWAHALPVEGVIGHLIAGSLIVYLNMQGAWLVAAALAGARCIYFAFAVSSLGDQTVCRGPVDSLHGSWNDRWRNWREERAEAKAEREAALAAQQTPGPNQRLFSGSIDANAEESVEQKKPFRLSSLWTRRDKNPVADPVDEIPAFQRAAAGAASRDRSRSGDRGPTPRQHLGAVGC